MVYLLGKGRIGQALHRRDSQSKLVGRDFCVSSLASLQESDLVFLCTRNDALEPFFAKLPAKSFSHIVLVQNGMLSEFLASYPAIAARCILYFAVADRESEPKVGGDTLVSGAKATEVVAWFQRLGIAAKVVSEERMAQVEMEKLLWNSVMGLVGERYQESVGESLQRWPEIEEILMELIELIEKDRRISFDRPSLLASLREYSAEVKHFSARIKEWTWRNEWFFKAAQRQAMRLPRWERMHAETSFAGLAASYHSS